MNFTKHMIRPFGVVTALAAAALLAGCGGNETSTAEVEEAAKEHVRQNLGLSKDAALFSDVFVGEPVDGETVICGTVSGTRTDGSPLEPRRFAVSAENNKWLLFESAAKQPLPSQPDKFVEWHTTCRGEKEA